MKNIDKKKIIRIIYLLVDIFIALQLYEFYTNGLNKFIIMIVAAIYIGLRLYIMIRNIRRRKLKREFNEIFPE